MRKTIIISATVLSAVLIGIGAYFYFLRGKSQTGQPRPLVVARVLCSPAADFGTLVEFEPDLKELVGAIRQNSLTDSIYNAKDFVLEWHKNPDNNKNIPMMWFFEAAMEERLTREFPQKLSDNKTVNEMINGAGQRTFFRVFPSFVVFSVSADILERIPTDVLPPVKEKKFSPCPSAFVAEFSDGVLQSLEGKQDLLPSFTGFYMPFDSVSGFLNTDNNNILFRFFTTGKKHQLDIWNQVASTSNSFVNFIPWDVSSFEAFSFTDFPLLFNRMRTIPDRKAAMEKYTQQYQMLPSDTIASMVGNWVWSANLDITERGEYMPIAGIQIADTLRTARFLSTVCIPLTGEQMKVPGSKEVVHVQQLTAGNFFKHLFPSGFLQSDTVFVMIHRNHLWLATSPKILRYMWGTYTNNLVLGKYLELNRATWYYYKNIKKLRAALSSTDNSRQAMFLRSFYEAHNQAEHCLLEIDFSVKPGGGTFRIW